MQELIELANALAAFLLKFGIVGWITFIIILLLWKGKVIFDWIAEHIIKRFAPLWCDRRTLKLEQTKHIIQAEKEERKIREKIRQEEIQYQREQDIQEQVNTTMMWKDLIFEYRKRLDDSELAINRLQAKVFDVIAQNEKLNAQVLQSLQDYKSQNERLYYQIIEALRDVSGVLRAQTNRLDRMNGLLSKGES